MVSRTLTITFCLLAALGLPVELSAAQLKQVVQRAVNTHPEVRAAAFSREATYYELEQAKGGYNPTVDLEAAAGRERTDSPGTRASGNVDYLDRHDASVVFRQMLFDGFATPAEVDRQKARTNAAAYGLLGTSEQIALRATEVYIEVLRRRRLLALAQENLAAHERTFDQIKLRSDSGVGRKSDLDQVSGRLALAHANIITEQANLDDAESNYLRVTGQLPDSIMVYPQTEDLQVPSTMELAVDTAIANHPTLKSAMADVDATKAQHRAAKSNMYPRFDFEIEQGWNDNVEGTVGNINDRSVMIRMRYNLLNGGRDRARRKQTAKLINEAREVRNNTYRQVVESIRLSYNAYAALQHQVDFLRQHSEASSRSRDAYAKQFNIGKRSLLDLLDSENEVFESSRALVNAEHDELFALYRIQAGLGRLLHSLGVEPPTETTLVDR